MLNQPFINDIFGTSFDCHHNGIINFLAVPTPGFFSLQGKGIWDLNGKWRSKSITRSRTVGRLNLVNVFKNMV